MSYSLRPRGLQHARTALSPRVCSNSCPLSQWCFLTISSSAVPDTFCLQSFQASESFPMSWLISSSGQSTGASASASVLPMNSQGWFSLGLTGLISLQPRGHQESPPAKRSRKTNIWIWDRKAHCDTQLCVWETKCIFARSFYNTSKAFEIKIVTCLWKRLLPYEIMICFVIKRGISHDSVFLVYENLVLFKNFFYLFFCIGI